MVQSTVSPAETVRNHPDTEIVAKHTPTPWTPHLYESQVIIYGPGKIQVVATSWHSSIRSSYPLKPESLANAAFIVKAVNSHDALIASLREMIEVYWGEGDGQEPPPSCIQRAQRALS